MPLRRPPGAMIGGGARGMIERALAAEGRACAKAELDGCSPRSSRIMPRISPTARGRFRSSKRRSSDLAGAGHRLAVCTNKLEWLSVRLLNTLKLAAHFAAICGQDTFGVQKPDPRNAAADHPARRRRARRERSWSAIPGPTCAPPAPRACRSSPSISAIARCRSRRLQPDRIISSFADLPAAIRDIEAGARDRSTVLAWPQLARHSLTLTAYWRAWLRPPTDSASVNHCRYIDFLAASAAVDASSCLGDCALRRRTTCVAALPNEPAGLGSCQGRRGRHVACSTRRRRH